MDRYFVGCLVGHYLVARALPRPYRTWWQSVWIGLEGGQVAANYRVGITLEF